ncbi:MAG: flagellar protein FlgN [Geobacteraceae bacterium]|nr:flagellar protein FlgN [Geobacteraceae bacterium]NTW80926.1 flagellar protein FlgN [Geobacteraceae bacterium]
MSMHALIAALETQLHLLEEFLNLLNRETRELADIQLDAMAEINSRKESIVASIETHSALLRKEISDAAIREGLSPEATLGEVADRLKQKGASEVSRLHMDLNRVADRVRQLTSINREIAERFAASITSSLELLARVINQSNTYGASGGYQQRQTAAVLINREA